VKIAVVGSGIAGLTAAWMLQKKHQVTLFEARERLGGHTHTVDVASGPAGEEVAVDTGFIVFNRRTYPLFCKLLDKLGVGARDSDMGFSVQVEANGREYCGRGFGGLFAQRRNLLRPSHWRMLRDLLRFYREAPLLLMQDEDPTLGQYLQANGYSKVFLEEHLVPMAAAVWSSDPADILDFPARTLIRFFANHGFLDVKDRPQWLTIPGGSRTYLDAWEKAFRGELRLGSPVRQVRRSAEGVELEVGEQTLAFDHVVFASHGDQTLGMLEDADEVEREILGSFRFQPNEVVLHQDTTLLPKKRSTWSAWNYHVPRDGVDVATVTYWMNCLQGIETTEPLLVTLNRTAEIDPGKVLRSFNYLHPIFDAPAIGAQLRHDEIDARNRASFCGAYWRYGFHEDGVWSAVRVSERLGVGKEVLA